VRHEVQRVEPRSVMRVGFLVGLLGGFVFGLFEVLLLRALSAGGGGAMLPPEAQGLVNTGGGGLMFVALVTGLVLSLICALAGGLTAIFYNLGARLFGGIELSLSGPPPESKQNEEEGRDE
jgi:hypothetical protein